MDRNLALELVRVTEAAAIAASHWHGKGDKNAADAAAVEAMRNRLQYVDFSGVIVSGEGEKDEAPMLYTGEHVGSGKGTEVDIAVDPLECTTFLSEGRFNSLSVIAVGERKGLLPTPGTYMEQLCVGPATRGKINIDAPLAENLRITAQSLDKEISELTVAILERERNQKYIDEARSAGARITLFNHGTIANGIAPALEDDKIDFMIGVGGAPEAIMTACALKCMGGDMQARFRPHNEATKREMQELGFNEEQIFTLGDIAKDKVMFVASGVTDSPLLNGVRYGANYMTTHSVVMRSKTGTIRFVQTHHKLD